MTHPRERRLVQYRQKLQLALQPTVDTDAPKRGPEESDALEGLMSLFNEPNSKRQAVANSEPPPPLPPPAAPEPMSVDPPTQAIVPVAPADAADAADAADSTALTVPDEPVEWETKFGSADKILERLRNLTPTLQQNILTLLQTANIDLTSPTQMVFVEFQGYNPDSAPTTKHAGNTGKQVIWFEKGFNPGGSLYPRNRLQGDSVGVYDKNKSYFRVRVTGEREQEDAVIVTLHVADPPAQVTKAWAEAQIKAGAKYDAAPGPFLAPEVKGVQKKEGMSTVDELEFRLDADGFSIGPNDTIPELTIKHTDRSKAGGGTQVYRKFYLKITLKSNPAIYVTTNTFNIFGRVADQGRAKTTGMALPEEGYRPVLPEELDPSFHDGTQATAAAGQPPASGAGSSTDPLVATMVPPPMAAPDPE